MKPLPGYAESRSGLLGAEKLGDHLDAHDRPVGQAYRAGGGNDKFLSWEGRLLAGMYGVCGFLLGNDHAGQPVPLVS